MPVGTLRAIHLVAVPVHAVAVAVGTGIVGAARAGGPEFLVEVWQHELHFLDFLARLERGRDFLRRAGKAHEQAAVHGVKRQRPWLLATPDGGLAAILHDRIPLDPFALLGDRDRAIPVGPEAAHAGTLGRGDFDGLGGRGGGDEGEGKQQDRKEAREAVREVHHKVGFPVVVGTGCNISRFHTQVSSAPPQLHKPTQRGEGTAKLRRPPWVMAHDPSFAGGRPCGKPALCNSTRISKLLS